MVITTNLNVIIKLQFILYHIFKKNKENCNNKSKFVKQHFLLICILCKEVLFMLVNAIILAISASIDSFGVGITYGIKRTKISISAIIILFILSIFFTSVSITFGNILSAYISSDISCIVGASMLILIGVFILYGAIFKKEKKSEVNFKHTEYSFFIEFLGITINIIKDPINSDLDNSNKIDIKEAVFLGIAMSLDSMSIGFGCSTIGINSFLFPILTSFFQILFLCIGKLFGKSISKISSIPQSIWNIISGIILICIGIIKVL